jgi:hypothetical protein
VGLSGLGGHPRQHGDGATQQALARRPRRQRRVKQRAKVSKSSVSIGHDIMIARHEETRRTIAGGRVVF